MKYTSQAWVASGVLHAVPITLALVLAYRPHKATQRISFDVIAPTPAPLVEAITPPQTTPIKRSSRESAVTPAPKMPVTPSFGISDRAIEGSIPMALPQGNTLEVSPTQRSSNNAAAPTLPIPVAPYLVSQMPVLIKNITIPYPKEARDKGLQGSVVMELLIDEEGLVRDIKVLSGPGSPLNEAATQAAGKLAFKPAQRDEKSVAVRSRYTYIFDLKDAQ